jgi:hypothetical protein
MSFSPPSIPLSGVIITITLTAILLISSCVMTVFSPPSSMVMNVGLASATSSENNDNDDNNEGGEEEPTTDATTTEGEDEVVDGDVREEDNTEEQQPSLSTQEQDEDGGDEEEEQFAFMGVEICDDFQDNDGDGFIDLADTDCAAGPATQGALTAPTTPPPSASTTNATNSTINTLTSGLIGLPSSPTTPPPQSPPPTTTTTPQGGEQGQQQVPVVTKNPDGSETTTYPGGVKRTTFPGGISITKNPDGRVTASIPDSEVTIYYGPNGGVEEIDHPNGMLSRNRDSSVSALLPNTEGLRLRPDGIGEIGLGDDETTITGNRDGTLTISKPYIDPNTGALTDALITSTYSLDGNVATKNPDGSTTSAKIGSVNGGTTTFPGGISITKNPDGRVTASIPDSEVTIYYGPNGGVEEIDHPNGMLSRNRDGSVSALLRSDEELRLRPDGIGEIDLDEDGTIDITGNRDGTLTTNKPITDPNTDALTGIMTTTYRTP